MRGNFQTCLSQSLDLGQFLTLFGELPLHEPNLGPQHVVVVLERDVLQN